MAENGLPQKRPRKSLSLSKANPRARSRKPVVELKASVPSTLSSSSIISFFNHAPPPRIACPLCGEMVPRYGINKHIDNVCQKSQDDDVVLVASSSDVVAPPMAEKGPSLSSPYFAKIASTLEKSPDRAGGGLDTTKAGEQKSPYFKKDVDGGQVLTDGEQRVCAVKSVSLGSFSSRLSRRRRRAQQGDVLAQGAEGCSSQDVRGDATEVNSEEATGEGGSLKVKSPLVRFQRQHCGKEGSTAQDVAQDQHGGIFCGSTDDATPKSSLLDDPASSERGLSVGARGHQAGPVSNFEKNDVCKTMDNKEELFNLEDENFSSGEVVPLSGAGKAHHNQIQSFPSVGDVVKVLPMESHKDVRNETTDDRDLEKASFEHHSRNITEKALNGPSPESDPGDQPYYLRNFLMVLQAVLENEDDRRLFDEQDLGVVAQFYQLSAAGQKLYVRLFQRKLCWIKTNKIEYSEIGEDLSPVIEELIQARFLQSEAELHHLSEVLDLLPAPELKTLAKAFHLKNPNAQKQQLLKAFLQLAKQRSFFSRNQAGVGDVILKRAKDLAGKSVRLCKGPRAVFSRVLLLFSLSDPMEDEDTASGGQGQLSTVLMVNMGRMVFPTYTVDRRTPIFQDRDDFIRYATAAHLSSDISVAMAKGNWEEARRLYMTARETWQELKYHPSLRSHADLPEYLRCFTVGWVYTRILSRGVEILQRLHMYEEAVEQLQDLLAQEVYCTDSRGRWWDRLALNLHQHLKDVEKAVGCIRKGLLDPSVRTGHLLALSQRAQKMKELPACQKFRPLLQDLPLLPVEDVVHVTIKGRLCPQTGMGKSVFIVEDLGEEDQGENPEPSAVMCSVEELALTHYKQSGFDQGIHGEGSTFSTLYGLLMWDVLFMDGIPDVFRNPYQAFPLDLYTDRFYENRRLAIESRLQALHGASPETLVEWVAEVWSAQEGKAAALISWERFSSLQQAQSLVRCLGGPFLSGICRRLSKDLRHCKGGLPDLVVWRTEDCQFKLVEVKGPRDRLSHKQMLWLAELQRLGAPVEVCHVAAVGYKSKHLC